MILFLYVLRDFFKYVIGTIVLSLFLFVLFDFIHKSTKYLARYNPETKHLVQFYIYQIPNLIIQSFPIAALLASVIAMVLLSRTNEITAMRAAGMGPMRVGLPIAAGGLILSLLSVVIGEFVLPYTSKKMHYVQSVLMEKQSENHIAEGARWIRGGDLLYNFKDYDPMSKRMIGVKVLLVGNSFRPKRIVEGKEALYRNGQNDWALKDVRILYFWPSGTVSYSEKRDEYILSIPVKPEKLKKERRLPNELSVQELKGIVKQGEVSGVDVLAYKVDMQMKFAFHFSSFVVCLIGLKFGYKSERSVETARGVILAIAIGISYWFILNAGVALGKRGTLPPIVSAWLANIIIFVVAMTSILKTRKT